MHCPACAARLLPTLSVCSGCGRRTEAEPPPRAPGRDPRRRLGDLVDGRYVLESVLGVGSTGAVYGARDEVAGGELALKLLHPELATDTTLLKRFDREARITESLRHPHVVRLLHHGVTESGTPFLAMERLDGPNLLTLVSRVPAPSPARLATLFGQVLEALEVAHAAGVVHRDLKLENVVVVTDGEGTERAKVCDFGIAQLTAPEDPRLTARGMICGTPEYVAPEQARGRQLDGRADLYAVGVGLYRALTGVYPFREESAVATLTAHVRSPVIPARTRAPERHVPRSLERVCAWALAKAPDARPQDAAALRLGLARAVAQLGERAKVPLGTPGPDPSAAAPAPARARHVAFAGALAAAALLGTALAAYAS
ncbi:MAG: serine/threonine-protein kinase [Myxococcota bacterium]